jgi:hypothetical protein
VMNEEDLGHKGCFQAFFKRKGSFTREKEIFIC